MITFLRKLRRSDMTGTGSSFSTGRYLKYALGEIVLVVIGILIALSINDHSQYLKDRKKEVYTLQSIKSNLNEDIGLLFKIIYSNQQVLAKLDTASIILSGARDWPVYSLTTNLEALIETYHFTTNRTGIDQMISSSQMDIIQNRQLTEQLFLYYRDIEENTKGNETEVAEYSRITFGPALLGYDDMSNPKKSLIAYRSDPLFGNSVSFKQKAMRLMVAEYLKIQKKAQRLVALMDEELNRLK
ncbi:MAG: hypothetical protein HEP71_29945 [Roseivirga sp.]|nr:hypothetical protein [Roseivirga sp.]